MDYDGPEDDETNGDVNGTNGNGMMNGNGTHEHETIHEEIAA
jgi:hypothetical protein